MPTFNAYVHDGPLNLRSAMSTGSNALASIPENANLTVTPCGNNEWFQATYNGVTGYVVAQYVAITSGAGVCRVNNSGTLNIRKTTSTSSTKLYGAAANSTLTLLDNTSVSGWWRVSSAQGTGWAMSQYLILVTAPPTDENGGTNNTTLQLGDTGSAVSALQNKLSELRYYPGVSEGYYDGNTEWAVKYFQHLNFLPETGIANAATISKINDPTAIKAIDDTVYYRGVAGPAVPDLKMNDSLWANISFDASGTTQVETIGDSGNAPAAIAIAFSTILKRAMLPPMICNYVMNNGYRDHTGNNGVTSQFFNSVAVEYNMKLLNIVDDAWTNLDTVKNHCNTSTGDCIALLRVTGNTAHNYCGIRGATYLVVYKIDNDYIYIQNPNGNASGSNISRLNWSNKRDWIKEAYLYQYWPRY